MIATQRAPAAVREGSSNGLSAMTYSRRFVLCTSAVAALAVPFRALAAADGGTAVATVRSFYDALSQAMKGGTRLGFAGRRKLLAPAVTNAFDLPFMTQLAVGMRWSGLSSDEQQTLIRVFSAFSVATYASHFDNFSGERFDVDPTPTPAPNDAVIVRTKLVSTNDEPVELDYLMRHTSGGWRIVDVYLSGTISELAARRSEFTAILQRGGTAGLIERLQTKTAQLDK